MEEFRTLRARLFQIRAKRPLKTILVSSALPNEGKSFVSGNLAQVFARQSGGRTLLIDCDLRKPQLHEMLGAPYDPGLSEYFKARATNSRSSRNPGTMTILHSGRRGRADYPGADRQMAA